MKKIYLYILGAIAIFSLITALFIPGKALAEDSCSWHSNSNINCGTGEFWLDVDLTTKFKDVLIYKNHNNSADGYLVLNTNSSDDHIYWLKNTNENFDFGNLSSVKGTSSKVQLNNNDLRDQRSYSRGTATTRRGMDTCNTASDNGNNDCYNVNSWTKNSITIDGKMQTLREDGSFNVNGEWHYFVCDIYVKVNQLCWDQRDTGRLMAMTQDKHDKLINNDNGVAHAKSTSDCVSSPLSFFLCPLSDFITKTWTTIIQWFIDLLQNPTIKSTSPVNTALHNFINLANGIYILIFISIIFANFFAVPGLDNYSIKKMLPKLIGAIIITQFSFLICGAILDITNILGDLLPKLILQSFNNTATSAGEAFACALNPLSGVTNACGNQAAASNIGADIGKWLMMFITEIVALCVALYALVYLIFRYMFLIILIIFSPIAFAAWVLPNTEQYFKKWWNYFFRLCIMYLLVNTLFAFGAVMTNLFSEGLGGSGVDSFLTTIVAVLVPTITIALVPRMLKVSGQAITAAKDGVKKLQSSASESAPGKMAKTSLQQGKLAQVKGGAMQKFGEKVGGRGGRLGNFGIGMEAKGAALTRKPAELRQENISKLSLGRQMEIANGKSSSASDAKVVLAKKLQELSNTRNLSATQLVQLEALKGSISSAQLNSGGSITSADGRKIDFEKNGKVTAVGGNPGRVNELFVNPNWGGGGSSLSSSGAKSSRTPSYTPGGYGSATSGGGGKGSGTYHYSPPPPPPSGSTGGPSVPPKPGGSGGGTGGFPGPGSSGGGGKTTP